LSEVEIFPKEGMGCYKRTGVYEGTGGKYSFYNHIKRIWKLLKHTIIIPTPQEGPTSWQFLSDHWKYFKK